MKSKLLDVQKILVTGSTGFIGHHVIQALLGNNMKVIATSSNLEKAKKYSWFPKVNYIPFDFSQLDFSQNYFEFFEKPDAMIHLAWEGLPNYKAAFHIENNLPQHKLLLANLLQNGLRNLTVSGTCFEYGMQEGQLNENMLSIPLNPYAQAKEFLRKYIEGLKTKIPFSFKWLRLFYLHGEGQNRNSILPQLKAALEKGEKSFNMSGGEQSRDYLPVTDAANYIVKAALQLKIEGIINCCSGKAITVNELVEDFLKKHNSQINLNKGFYPYTDYEPMHFWGNNKKLIKAIKN